jgi:hypothetical protein
LNPRELLDEYLFPAALVIGVLAALLSPLVVWMFGTRRLVWNWLALLPLLPVGIIYMLQMPTENYDYTGARGVFSVIVVVAVMSSLLVALCWSAGRLLRRKAG